MMLEVIETSPTVPPGGNIDDHEIPARWEPALVVEMTKDRTESAADPIPRDGVADAATDREGKAGMVESLIGCMTKAEWTAAAMPAGFAQEFELPPEPDRFDQALSLWRPLSRRDRMTLRPARSDMRWRKPCFLERRRLLG
jgi:hypothetical protein